MVNLLSRILIEVENFLLFKGLLFCFILVGIDIYVFRRDVLEYVRCIMLKEYFYKDDKVDGNFLDVLVFRKKLNWCLKKNRDFFLELYVNVFEKKIFEGNFNGKNYRNFIREE